MLDIIIVQCKIYKEKADGKIISLSVADTSVIELQEGDSYW